MTYQTAAAFRRALETRLVAESAKTGTPLVRLRKLVAFDRFLARLTRAYPHDWLLKGGLALQLRMGEHARTTQDVDVLITLPRAAVHSAVTQAVSLDLGDWFVFVHSIAGDLRGAELRCTTVQSTCAARGLGAEVSAAGPRCRAGRHDPARGIRTCAPVLRSRFERANVRCLVA